MRPETSRFLGHIRRNIGLERDSPGRQPHRPGQRAIRRAALPGKGKHCHLGFCHAFSSTTFSKTASAVKRTPPAALVGAVEQQGPRLCPSPSVSLLPVRLPAECVLFIIIIKAFVCFSTIPTTCSAPHCPANNNFPFPVHIPLPSWLLSPFQLPRHCWPRGWHLLPAGIVPSRSLPQ